ncbi:TPA: hypothetical protein KOT89_003683 [Clostridioides difficile]|uniref:hypothetical protein n=1 Tax=Clostridioides difficile TaxID=1496 RepID=UPI00093C70A2|nr:hypothetical protein [Clostridioides difficile]EGT5367508.1 hypothetical protein [Clostridioides difficile]MBF9909467.1 hypothetical protein [Clostridioides difficile]MCI9910101.1 hypothetical protein [Clostridioides difficile]MCZ6388229.1 hypothetical protein [Clostridioides difficile]TQZ43893.1 hypothetical protein EWL96_13025 [Clostridioides difficile]
MYFVIGFITILGIVIGILSMLNNRRKIGIYQIVLSIIFPILTCGFCIRKSHFVFGGTDFEFLLQTAIIDKRLEPWIILGLFIILIITISINIWSLIKVRKHKF